ncbi:hypothetical protein DUPY_44260 [Duganella phyllosphaerae]|uniref:NAD-specific glutamate dehydrogenase n=1 Tax=Duganella phyllosphaerae TaxID=762836 RepID=A0A1E7WCI6_9BURK|nr:hypothetical protein DUPY_44260 [Duganella phyllosphaerae]
MGVEFRFLLGLHPGQRHRAQLVVGFDARFGGGHDAGVRFAPGLGAGGGHHFQPFAVERHVADFLFGLQAQVQRLGGAAVRLGLGQGDLLALLLQVGQRACFFQRPHFGGGAVEGRFERDLVGALALHGQVEGFGFGFGQHLRGLARRMGMALALARHGGHAGVGAGNAHHLVLGGLHRSHAFDRLQAGLFGFHFQFVGGARSLGGERRFDRDLLGGAQAAFVFGTGPLFGSLADQVVRFHAGAQFGGFLLDGVEPGHAGLGGGAQRFEAVAVGGNRVFGCLGVLLGGGSGGGVHRGAVFGQGTGARLGVGAVFGGAGGFRFGFHAGDGFLDRLHFHGCARRVDGGRRLVVQGDLRQRVGQGREGGAVDLDGIDGGQLCLHEGSR